MKDTDDKPLFDEEKGKKPKKKSFNEVEYDPDLDMTIVRRRRKRDGTDDTWDDYLD